MRYLPGLGLALVLVFAISAVSLAVPVAGAEAGQLAVFADRDWWADNVGAGYGITDDITAGGVYDLTNESAGIFAHLALHQLAVQAEIWFVAGNLATVTALWNFVPAPFALGIGGGLDHGPWYDEFFLAAAAHLELGESWALYGAVRYFPSGGVYSDPYCIKAGISVEF